MTTTSMISTPHVILLWLVLIGFFIGAFAVLVVRERKSRRARRNERQEKKDRQR